MKVLDPGHVYELEWLDGEPEQVFSDSADDLVGRNELVFVKREGDGYPGNVGRHAGTNMQEVLRALIDRVKYLDNQIHDDRNELAIAHLRSALWQFETRAATRHGRTLVGFNINQVETYPTCQKCGHVGCVGSCRSEAA